MSNFESHFNRFLVELGKCPYDLPSDLNPHFKAALLAAGFDTMGSSGNSGNSGSTGGGVTKTRKLSGYNVYMKEKMAELKAQNVPSGERMGKVSAMWKTLSDEEKGTWKSKADGLNPSVEVSSNTTTSAPKTKKEGPTKLSGYQLFVKEKMAEVKADTSIPAKERMTKIGALWKACSQAEQEVFKKKAETVNAEAAAAHTTA